MHSIRRLLCVWVMALALPLQGIAAAGMMHCGPGSLPGQQPRHVAPAGPDHVPASAPQAHGLDERHARGHDHGHDHGHEHGHKHVVKAGEVLPSPVLDDAASPAPDAQMSKADHKCSACAACNVALATPPAAAHIALPELSSEPLVANEDTPASFIASGPERPPRTALA